MRLLIISAMPHHKRDGVVVGWGATVRELDRLATRFDSVRHIAFLYDEPAPSSAIAYTAKNVELVPVPPSGAEGFLGKLDVLRTTPQYLRAILRELPHADMVHVRAPANIALLAMVLLSAKRRPIARWFKYAGNWQPDGRESPSYTFQRWWLGRSWHRGIVTVNGQWPEQPEWVRTFFNPSLDDGDIERGLAAAKTKRLTSPMRIIFVGRVESPKGANRAIEILAKVRARRVDATLDIVGDGDERAAFEQLAQTSGVANHVHFRGWLSPVRVQELLADSHVMLLPTRASEGWPKVLSEGMAYGVVPVAGAVSSIPQYLGELGTGFALPHDDLDGFAAGIARYATEPARWAAESRAAIEATRRFSFGHYLDSIDKLLTDLRL